MHKKFWFLVAAAVAVFALTGTAAATGGRHMTLAQKNWANIKWSPQTRAQSGTLNFGMEQGCAGFNGLDIEETAFWCVVAGEVPVVRGNYIVGDDLVYHNDLITSATSTTANLTINIKDGAQWAIEGGDTHEVTAADYAFTYNVIMDPRNPVASTTGYSNFKEGGAGSTFTINNPKQIVFHWKSGQAFADWKDLFGFILPQFALPSADDLGASAGKAFDEMWRNCVCLESLDSNGDIVDHLGQQVSDGPFFLDSWDPGTGAIDTPNNRWYGPDANLSQVNFVRTTPGSTEASGLTGGTLDAAFPAPAAAYVGIRSNANFHYDSAKGYVQEHADFNQANPLMAHNWFRQAVALGINRPALIKATYYDTNIVAAGSMSQLNSPEYVLGKYSKAPYDYYKTWNFDRTHALTIMKNHCTGGPASPSNTNSKIWQCPDGPAHIEFWTTSAPVRAQSASIYQAQLKTIGIDLNPNVTSATNLFGNILPNAQTNSCISGGVAQPCGADTYDMAEYAWVGGVDPSGFNAIYECWDTNGKGGQNYKNYCKPKIDLNQAAGDKDLSATRYNHYLTVSKIVSSNALIYPLYARPNILIYRSSVGGMAHSNNPTSTGPSWNMEDWIN
ncbi:MAG: glutathione transport system substrate-binding protein [Gaiellaceae bacterium]|jgi:ABC-type transport system substrate-binding protein|nr:glutathione transport system substrate-binding protein [Gaiellaceae bacterium]